MPILFIDFGGLPKSPSHQFWLYFLTILSPMKKFFMVIMDIWDYKISILKCVYIKYMNSNIYCKKLLYINDHIKTRMKKRLESFLKQWILFSSNVTWIGVVNHFPLCIYKQQRHVMISSSSIMLPQYIFFSWLSLLILLN